MNPHHFLGILYRVIAIDAIKLVWVSFWLDTNFSSISSVMNYKPSNNRLAMMYSLKPSSLNLSHHKRVSWNKIVSTSAIDPRKRISLQQPIWWWRKKKFSIKFSHLTIKSRRWKMRRPNSHSIPRRNELISSLEHRKNNKTIKIKLRKLYSIKPKLNWKSVHFSLKSMHWKLVEVFRNDWMNGLNAKINASIKSRKLVRKKWWENAHLVPYLRVHSMLVALVCINAIKSGNHV